MHPAACEPPLRLRAGASRRGTSARIASRSLVLLFALAFATPAAAQRAEPIRKFAVDVQGSLARLPVTGDVGTPRDLPVAFLPSLGWGFSVGAHVYPVRWKAMTLGAGLSIMRAGHTRTQDVAAGQTTPIGPDVTTRIRAFSPQVSFNFGKADGFSYISGGIGRATVAVSRADRAEEPGDGSKTINYGGGARWFVRDHLGYSFDVRFYAINPTLPSVNTAGHGRMTKVVFSGGVSFK